MKIVASGVKPPVVVEFSHEEARLLWQLAGFDATIPATVQTIDSTFPTINAKLFLQQLRRVLQEEVK